VLTPAHLWLDEAMEGPNPASILRNSVVVVGAYVLIKLRPILALLPVLTVLVVIGTVTAIGAFNVRSPKSTLSEPCPIQRAYLVSVYRRRNAVACFLPTIAVYPCHCQGTLFMSIAW